VIQSLSMNLLLFFFLISSSLFASLATTENQPSSLVEGIVSAVTGDLYALEEDIVIQGAEPLKIKRSYISAKGHGAWQLFHYAIASYDPLFRTIQVVQPNGTLLAYERGIVNKKPGYYLLNLVIDGLTNTGSGVLSGSTNLWNQHIEMSDDGKAFTLFAANGTRKIYRRAKEKRYEKLYLLQLEELPNGNKILYTWDKMRPTSIETKDPSERKTYAAAHIKHHGKASKFDKGYYFDNLDATIYTSDGRELEYRFFGDGKKEEKNWYLTGIRSTDSPWEQVHCHDPEKKQKRKLKQISLVQGRTLQVNYYPSGEDKISSNVQSICAPVGAGEGLEQIQQFSYNIDERRTRATDALGVPTDYFWDENQRLTRIDHLKGDGSLRSRELFIWGDNASKDATRLISKALCDEKGEPVKATRYFYDRLGNVSEEHFYGNLSGKGAALHLDARNLPVEGGEVSVRKSSYSQDGKNLLLRKEEPNGLVSTYSYLPGTNLPLEEQVLDQGVVQRRTSYEYNSDRLLVRETFESGTTKLVKIFFPRPGEPFVGMPEILEEKSAEGLLKKTYVHYTTGGRIFRKEVYDATGALAYTLNYKYDGMGRLIEESNALGQIAKSHYDDLGNKTFFQDFGRTSATHMSYDLSNRLIESKEEGSGISRITRHRYDKKHNKIASIDPYGYETKYTYDESGNVTGTHLPELDGVFSVTRSTYDAAGRVISSTDAKGYTTTTEYNAYDKPILTRHPDGSEEKWIYNLDGTLKIHVDEEGTETHYTYELFDRPLTKQIFSENALLSEEKWSYDSLQLASHTDAEGHCTLYSYDSAGRKIQELFVPTNETTLFTYDNLGRLVTTKKGELVTHTIYDLLDRVVEERKEDASGKLLSYVGYTYDNAGSVATKSRIIDGKKAEEQFEYDCLKRLTEKKNALGNSTRTFYKDELHQKITIDPLGLQTVETFNSHYSLKVLEKISPQGNLLLQERLSYDPNDNPCCKESILPTRQLTTRWEYGPLNRLSELIEGAGTAEQKTTSYTYTPKGYLRTTKKPSGILLTCTYNALGQQISQVSSDETVHYTYSYDRLGHLLGSSDGNFSLTRTYDPKGRLLSETLPTGLHFTSQYDQDGRRIRLTLPDSSFVAYEHDVWYLRSVHRYTSAGELLYTHSYTSYDLSGNLLTEILIGNLGSSVHKYDLANRALSHANRHFAQEVQYDAVGNILASSIQGERLDYTYDPLYQITSENGHTYTCDSYYNRLQHNDSSYSINALNQVAELTYDADGNVLSYGDFSLVYDALGRLVSVQSPTLRVTYAYDSYHRRLAKTLWALENEDWKEQKTTLFLYDDQNEIGSQDPQGTTLRILGKTPHAEIGSAIALELGGQIFAPIHDLHGNVSLVLALHDNSCQQYHYTAFGEEKFPSLLPNPWRFSSKRLDEETGFVYYGRRYYFPVLGRWLTPDPLGFEAGPNLYAFVSNAPLTHLDPYGLMFYGPQYEGIRQSFIGSIHSIGGVGIQSALFLSKVGYGITVPARSIAWASGYGSFSQSLQEFRSSNRYFEEVCNRGMHRLLPGDTSHRNYQIARGGCENGITLGLAAPVAYGTARTVVRGGQLLMREMSQASRLMQGKFTGDAWRFPRNPKDLLKDLPRDTKGRIYPNDRLRIKPEQHPLKAGEVFCPRHHGQHYHLEVRVDPSKSWNNKGNTYYLKPPDYIPGEGTGFLPGELFPGH